MKKQVLSMMMIIAAYAMSGQSIIWQPYNSVVDTSTDVKYLSVVDTNTVWGIGYSYRHTAAASNKFTRTINGSAFVAGTFLPDTVGFNASNISAVSASTAYIPCYFKAATGRSGIIRKTTNGGTTWTTISDTTTMFTGTPNFPDWVYAYKGNNTVVALGDPNPTNYEIWRSFNAGTTWTRVPVANIPVPLASEYGLTNSYAAFGKFLWYGTTAGRVYRSADTGKTWNVAQIAGMAGGCTALAFRDSIHGFAFGYATTSGGPMLRKTADGGATWTAINLLARVGTNGMCAIPKTKGFMTVGLDSVHTSNVLTSVTYDDGVTWTILESGSSNLINNACVQMVDSLHGWGGAFSDNTLPKGNWGMNKFTHCAMTISSNPTSVCLGGSANLLVGGATSMSYTWMPGGSTAATLSVTPASTTVYSVTGVKAGCNNTVTYTLTVSPTPTITVTSSVANDTVCSGLYNNTTTLTASGGTTYMWAPPAGLNSTTVSNPTCHPTSTTVYTVTGYNGACKNTKTIQIAVKSCVGINQYSSEDHVSVYPNPGTGLFNLRFGKPAIGARVLLTDMIGKQVYQAPVTNGATNYSLDFTSLPKGVYFLSIMSNGSNAQVQKLIIE